MAYDLLLFDLDDTLCDYMSARAERLRRAFGDAFAEAGIATEIDLDEVIAESIAIHPHGADHFGAFLASLGVRDPASAVRAREWYQTNRFHGLRLFPDALDLLASVRVGRKVGLITNGPAEVQRAKVELLNLSRHVDFVLISGEFGCAKPHAAIFEEGLRLGGATAERTAVVGDSPEFDIAGAKNAGMTAIWVNRGGHSWTLPDIAPDHEVDSLTAILHHI